MVNFRDLRKGGSGGQRKVLPRKEREREEEKVRMREQLRNKNLLALSNKK